MAETHGTVTLHHGDCLDVLRELPDASVDAVCTDPPYGLEFMGKEWDSFKTYAGGNPNMKPQGANVGESSGVTYGLRQKNPRCRRCGKLMRGNGACKCPEPQPDTRTAEGANQYQFWCEEWAGECLRVLKPGGHLLAFGGTRTSHRLACAIEDAGFEIRDSIAWLYGSGFPKSLDVSKAIDATQRRGGSSPTMQRQAAMGDEYAEYHGYGDGETTATKAKTTSRVNGDHVPLSGEATDDARTWQGWGTALKPAHEPIVVARKPLAVTVAANVLAHGTGALNVDGCRVEGANKRPFPGPNAGGSFRLDGCKDLDELRALAEVDGKTPYGRSARATLDRAMRVIAERDPSSEPVVGRWPANVVLDESQARELDLMSGTLTSGTNPTRRGVDGERTAYGDFAGQEDANPQRGVDIGGASRFMYVAKAGADERVRVNGTAHPTVKPLALMRRLVRLVTPPGGTVLEPFAGSGTTVEACLLEGFACIAIEREADYLPLIRQRINRRRDPVAAVKATGDDGGLFDLLDGEATA